MLRRIDGGDVSLLKENSHKDVIFNCELCNIEVKQQYRNYLKQKNGKFCRSCRNKITASRNDIKEKQSKASKERWSNDEYKKNLSNNLSISCKKSWDNNDERKKYLSINNPMKNEEIKKKAILKKTKTKIEDKPISKIEKEIENHLIENNILYVKKDSNFFLNDGKVEVSFVEANKYPMKIVRLGLGGVDSDFFYNQSKEAEENGSFKYFIKDFEWLDDNKREIMKSQILHLTNKTPYRFYARDTEVKIFNNRDVKQFEIENCFYGYRSSSLNIGLVLKKEKYGFPVGTLLMLMTFGKNFFAKKDGYIEVFRAGTLRKCQVIGGASKLMKYFIDNYPTIKISDKNVSYNKVVYYVDYDHGSGKSVGSMGFNWVRDTKGGFMNVDVETNKVSHRKPMHHGEVMQQIKEGKVYSIPNSGVKVYEMDVKNI